MAGILDAILDTQVSTRWISGDFSMLFTNASYQFAPGLQYFKLLHLAYKVYIRTKTCRNIYTVYSTHTCQTNTTICS